MIKTIYIPTYKRANDQVTLNGLPKDISKKMVTLVVQKQELSEHKQYQNRVNRIMEVDNNIGIAKTRELICKDAGSQRFYMIDDDIIFHRRNRKYYKEFNNKSNMKKSKRIATEKDIEKMFKIVDGWLNDPDLISVGHRRHFYPPYRNKSYVDNTLAHGVVAIDGKKLQSFIKHIEWDTCQYCEDVNFNFEYMTRGYKNRITDEFCAQMGFYQKGGVNEDRNAKTFKESHDNLMNRWPEYVTLKEEPVVRETIGEITEYKYDWRKAYKDGIINFDKTQPPKRVDKHYRIKNERTNA